MEVPEHDVVTRRKQFRSKKDKADKKKAKKDEKKAEKDKTKQKGDEKPKKKGRTAKEKQEDQKKTTVKAKDRAGENASPSSSKTPPASSAASKASPSKSSTAVVSRKMKRLRRMSTAKACMGVKTGTDSEAIVGAECQEVDMQPPSEAEKKKKKKEKKTPKEGNTTKEKKERKGKSSTQKASKASKGGKKKGSEEKKKKGPGETKGAKRSKKVKEEIAVDQKVKDLVLKTLKECQCSHCTHPSYVAVEVDGLDNSIYWSRKAVGVKIDRHLLSNPKAKGKGKAQIAYFGGKTPCTYSNMVLAGLFVTRLGLINHMSISNHSILFTTDCYIFCIGPCIT